METGGTPALTGYSCQDFPSRTTRSRLLLRKDERSLNIWPKISQDLGLWRRPACQTLSKALDISSATARAASDLLKNQLILPDTTVRKSAVDREGLKPYWKPEKRPHFSRWSTILLLISLSKALLTTERRLTGRWIQGPPVSFCKTLKNKILSDTHWRVQQVCMKFRLTLL